MNIASPGDDLLFRDLWVNGHDGERFTLLPINILSLGMHSRIWRAVYLNQNFTTIISGLTVDFLKRLYVVKNVWSYQLLYFIYTCKCVCICMCVKKCTEDYQKKNRILYSRFLADCLGKKKERKWCAHE